MNVAFVEIRFQQKVGFIIEPVMREIEKHRYLIRNCTRVWLRNYDRAVGPTKLNCYMAARS